MIFHVAIYLRKMNDVATGILNLATNVQNCHVNLNSRFKFQNHAVTRDVDRL